MLLMHHRAPLHHIERQCVSAENALISVSSIVSSHDANAFL